MRIGELVLRGGPCYIYADHVASSCKFETGPKDRQGRRELEGAKVAPPRLRIGQWWLEQFGLAKTREIE